MLKASHAEFETSFKDLCQFLEKTVDQLRNHVQEVTKTSFAKAVKKGLMTISLLPKNEKVEKEKNQEVMKVSN